MKRIVTILFLALTLLSATGCKQKAKYVFLFIGDGMGFGAVSVTETYLAQTDSTAIGMGKLAFSDFPVMGAAATFSANRQRTDSAAGGSALSAGEKVNNDSICISPEGDTLTSITYKLHDAGYKIGIAATVCIDHATPAAFFGRNIARGNYYEIGSQLADTGFEFFGGGDFNRPYQAQPDCFAKAQDAGYSIAYGREEFAAKKGDGKVIFFQKRDTTHATNQLPTRLERIQRANPDDITLKELVTGAIDVLDNPKGFFVMAEGSMIDWAAHSNDVAGLVNETIDMSDAIEVALEFYKKHPKNTLIVVTADHETGGVTLPDGNIEQGVNEVRFLWGDHTGCMVPVFAYGPGAQIFSGIQENTDIPAKIRKLMEL